MKLILKKLDADIIAKLEVQRMQKNPELQLMSATSGKSSMFSVLYSDDEIYINLIEIYAIVNESVGSDFLFIRIEYSDMELADSENEYSWYELYPELE